jgi:hypothetical protein
MMQTQDGTTTRGPRAGLIRKVAHVLLLLAIFAVSVYAVVSPTRATAQDEGSPSSGVLQTPADIALRIGETATLDDGHLLVTLMGVTEDSRCPKDVMCVWSGRASVALHVVVDGLDRGDVTATLYPGRQDQRSPDRDAVVDRYVLALIDLQPYPDRSQAAPAQVVATIRAEVAPANPSPPPSPASTP